MVNSKKISGYKTVPESWDIKQVREISTLEKNAILTGPFGLMLHSSDYVEFGIPLILVKNIKRGKIDVTGIPYVTEKDAQRLAKYRVKEGDIVFTRVGRVGSSALIEKEHEGWLISGQTLRIRFDNHKINPKYINYFFQSDVFSNILSKEILGMTRDSINTSILSEISVLVPTLSEQEKIILIISRIDNLIESYDKVIETTQQLKTGLMQKLLTKGIGHKKFKKIKWLFGKEIEIPEEWELKNLTNLDVKTSSGGTPNRENTVYFTGENLWIKSGELKDNFLSNSEEKITDKAIEDSSAKIFPRNSVLVAMYGATIGKTAILEKEASTNQAICVIPPNKKFDSLFLQQFLIQKRNLLVSLGMGAGQPNISQELIKNFKYLIPPLQQQQKIASILSSMNTEISELKYKKSVLEKLKKGLMQKLLTGQIRV